MDVRNQIIGVIKELFQYVVATIRSIPRQIIEVMRMEHHAPHKVNGALDMRYESNRDLSSKKSKLSCSLALLGLILLAIWFVIGLIAFIISLIFPFNEYLENMNKQDEVDLIDTTFIRDSSVNNRKDTFPFMDTNTTIEISMLAKKR